MSHGARARRRYGTSGAAGEAQAGFPHVRRTHCPRHAARRAGLDEASARLDALLCLVAHLDDTCVLHRGGATVELAYFGLLPHAVGKGQGGAMLTAAVDRMCLDRRLSPGGSGDLLSATLFLDTLEERTSPPCKP
jgi:triphosphoribosyl-dephospho-CoA synthase